MAREFVLIPSSPDYEGGEQGKVDVLKADGWNDIEFDVEEKYTKTSDIYFSGSDRVYLPGLPDWLR